MRFAQMGADIHGRPQAAGVRHGAAVDPDECDVRATGSIHLPRLQQDQRQRQGSQERPRVPAGGRRSEGKRGEASDEGDVRRGKNISLPRAGSRSLNIPPSLPRGNGTPPLAGMSFSGTRRFGNEEET